MVGLSEGLRSGGEVCKEAKERQAAATRAAAAVRRGQAQATGQPTTATAPGARARKRAGARRWRPRNGAAPSEGPSSRHREATRCAVRLQVDPTTATAVATRTARGIRPATAVSTRAPATD